MDDIKRNEANEIGDIGESTILFLAAKNRDWIARKVDKDFGVDIEMELVDVNRVTGQYIKVQVKGTENCQIVNHVIPIRIKTKFLRYCEECRVPILLVLVDAKHNIAYYIWVQEYLRQHQLDIRTFETVEIKIPAANDFCAGLKNQIKDIASGLNHTQLQLDLKACVSSAFLLGDQEVYEQLSALSLDIAKTSSLEIDRAINDLIVLGSRAWVTLEGNKTANMLYTLCRKYGGRFTMAHVDKTVRRGDSYSRVGIIALGILYDEYPDHLKSLHLADDFRHHEDPRIVYYCKLRERYLGMTSMELLGKKNVDYSIGNLTLAEMDRLKLFLYWPNRGDSAILDYLTPYKPEGA